MKKLLMKNLLIILSLTLCTLIANSQSHSFTKDTSINGYNLRVTTITNANVLTDSANAIICFTPSGQAAGQTPPVGFTGTQYDYDTSLIAVSGPHHYMRASGWDGGITLADGQTRYPVIITFQCKTSFERPGNINSTIATIMTRYRIKKKCVLLCGASSGAWVSGQYSTDQPSANDYSYISKVRAVFMYETVDLSDTYDATPAFAGRYQFFATKGALSLGGKLLAFQQTGGLNGHSHEAVDTMNSYVSGSAQWVSTSFGDGSHGCCFDNVFGGSSTPQKSVVFSMYQDVYQWLLRQGDSSLNISGSNISPVATASVSNNGYVLQPASSSSLTGSGNDIDGSISSYAWTQVSGPGTATITTPTSASTTVTSLILGTYVFRLTVTDNLGATGTADATVKVICSTCVVAICKPYNHSIPYTQAYDSLKGDQSIGVGLVYQWKLTNPDATAASVGHIVHPTTANTFIRILPYNANGWIYELTVSNGSNTAKDTEIVSITWPNMPPQSSVFHLATAVDTAAIGLMGNPGLCKINDFIIDGANDGFIINGQKTDIFTNGFGGNTFGAGQKILIKAGRYGHINLNFTVGQVQAPNTNPVIITNYGGQVECLSFSMTNAVNVELTGKYLPGISGHPSYTGFDGGGAFRWRTSGIVADNHWNTLDGACFNISGYSDSVTVHDIMKGDGAFAGGYIKQNDIPESEIFNHYRHFKWFKNFTFFAHGEDDYWGGTGCDSCGVNFTTYQHMMTDFDVHDNINAFSGNEIFQFGQMNYGVHIYRNVFFMSAMNRLSTFQDQQDFGIQTDARNGGVRIDSNIVVRSGEQIPSIFLIRKHNLTWDGDSIIFQNNLFTHGLGNIGGYAGGSLPPQGALLVIKNNIFGNYNFKASDVFSDVRGTNTQEVLRTQIGAGAHISVRNNKSDNTKTGFFTGFAGTFDTSGNTKISSITFPKFANPGFSNFMGDSVAPYVIERWVDTIEKTNGDENLNLSAQGMKQGQLKTFASGDWCIDLGFFYKSRINGNQGHMPYPADSTYWQIQSWNNGGNVSYFPPMDFRLPTTDPYQQLGMGLTATSNTNQNPTANAGPDQTITLPVSSVILSGSGTDADGSIASYAWVRTSGPNTPTIVSSSSASTSVTGLIQGTYVFTLTVTDNNGGTGTDTISIIVNPAIITGTHNIKQSIQLHKQF